LARDIHNVTDDVSLVMREVIDATENAMVLETALHLNKGAKSANAKDYIKTQMASKRQLNSRLQQVANKSQKMLNNVIDNIGAYTGTDTKGLKKDTASGMKMLIRSAKSMQNRTIKKVSRLERYKTSAQFIPNLDKSIISQTKLGIDKGLPVTYKNGRKVTYKAYMEMAVRTGIQQEIGDRQLEAGRNAKIVFYVVNEFGDCADDHADYQGKIYYDEKYLLFSLTTDAKAMIRKHIENTNMQSIQDVRDKPPYLTTRPNCRHKMKPVAIDRVLQENVEDIKRDLGYKRKSYRPENYEATKMQRYNERNIRKYKQRNLTYMALYKNTNNKEYLLQAQKEKRQAMLWQKRQREHMKANPDLFRDYERENPKVLLQDLGLNKKKIQADPNKPPAPITNEPPKTPPIAMSATVKEHLEVPEEKDEYLDIFPKHEYIMPKAFASRRLQIRAFDKWTSELKKEKITLPRVNRIMSKGHKLFYDNMKIVLGEADRYHIQYNRFGATLKVPNTVRGRGERRIKTFTHEYAHMVDLMVGRDITKRYARREYGLPTRKGLNYLTTGFHNEKDLESMLRAENPNLPQEVVDVIDGSKKMYQAIENWRKRNDFNRENKFDTEQVMNKMPTRFSKTIEDAKSKYEFYKETIYMKERKEAQQEFDEAKELINSRRNELSFRERWQLRNVAINKFNKRVREAHRESDTSFRSDETYGDTTALQDIFDAHTKGSAQAQGTVIYGHNVKYYNYQQGGNSQAEEVFANLTHLAMHNKEYYDMAKDTFPETVEAYENHIKALDTYIENIVERDK